MKLYYAPGACSIGIHVLLEEIGKPYDAERVNLQQGEQYKPPFTSVNPKSKVPTLVRDDGSGPDGVSGDRLLAGEDQPVGEFAAERCGGADEGVGAHGLCGRHHPYAGVWAAVPALQLHADRGG